MCIDFGRTRLGLFPPYLLDVRSWSKLLFPHGSCEAKEASRLYRLPPIELKKESRSHRKSTSELIG